MGGNATQPRAGDADVSSKPRQRRRDPYFWQLLVLRVPLAFLAVAIIAYLAHYVQKWQGAVRRPEDADDPLVTRKDAQEQSGLAYSMASVSLAVAVWEVVARLVPRYEYGPRPLGPFTIFFDLVVIGLGIPGWMYFAMAEYYTDPSYPTPWRYDQYRAATMVIIFWVLHCVMCIVGCSACCTCCGRSSEKSKTVYVVVEPTPMAQPEQRQDLEQAGALEPPPNYKPSTGLEEVEPDAHPVDPPSYPEAVRLTPHASS